MFLSIFTNDDEFSIVTNSFLHQMLVIEQIPELNLVSKILYSE